MLARARGLVAVASLLVACGSDSSSSPERLPSLTDLGGPVMTHPQLVTITYQDDPDRDTLDAHAAWIVTSQWLHAVGSEYGVGAGSVKATVHLAEDAPAAITDDQIAASLFQRIGLGTLPAPGSDPAAILYIAHFPQQTVVTAFGQTGCQDFGGYHGSARQGGVEIAYAVVPACSSIAGLTGVEGRELATSHEIIEAATDPIPSNHPGFQLVEPTTGWLLFGGEVADLCEPDPTVEVREAGFVAQRSWSNAAAAHGTDPCVPVPTGSAPYFSVFAQLDSVPRVAPGASTSLTLTGFSSQTVADWMLLADNFGDVNSTLTLSAATTNSGKTTQLSVGIPAGTMLESVVRIVVFSFRSRTDTEFQFLPIAVFAGPACSTFTGCEDCTSHSGCAWRAGSSKCEPLTSTTTSSSAALATWPGSCPGFCASHDTSCADCSGQVGCGWCATATGTHCLEAAADFAGPAAGTCAYADWSFTPQYCQ